MALRPNPTSFFVLTQKTEAKKGQGFTCFAQVFLDIVKSIKPDLTIIDFSIGIESDGPTMSNGGKPINLKDKLGSWAIVASTVIMAADATATRMMNHDVSK